MRMFLLLALGLLPGLVLLYFILFMDRNEKEPMGLVITVTLLGALSVVPAALIELGLGSIHTSQFGNIPNALLTAFFKVSWVEELCKLGVVLLVAWRNKNFNEENDGIVYVGSSTLGFAMLENVLYVFQFGLTVGILRAITAMPMHFSCGVIMGYYVGLAKVSPDPNKRKSNILKGFFLAFLLHGAYDALLMSRTPAGLLIIPVVIGFFVFGFRVMKKGRTLSLIRFNETPPAADSPIQQNLLIAVHPENQLWKAVISRTLLTLSGLFWGVIILAILTQTDRLKSDVPEILLGSIVLSFVPVFIGFMLEISYRRKRKIFRDFQTSQQVSQQPVETPLRPFRYPQVAPVSSPVPVSGAITPPGLLWRAFLSRSLLSVSALFWAIIIIGFLSQGEKDVTRWNLLFLGGFTLSFFPIYVGILTEDSYRKRKKLFNSIRDVLPPEKISPKTLVLSPPGQLWKIIVSRSLLGIGAFLWIFFILYEFMDRKAERDPSSLNFSNMAIVTILPLAIGILMEISYKKKKNESLVLIKNELSTPPADELKDYYQNLKARRDVRW